MPWAALHTPPGMDEQRTSPKAALQSKPQAVLPKAVLHWAFCTGWPGLRAVAGGSQHITRAPIWCRRAGPYGSERGRRFWNVKQAHCPQNKAFLMANLENFSCSFCPRRL